MFQYELMLFIYNKFLAERIMKKILVTKIKKKTFYVRKATKNIQRVK